MLKISAGLLSVLLLVACGGKDTEEDSNDGEASVGGNSLGAGGSGGEVEPGSGGSGADAGGGSASGGTAGEGSGGAQVGSGGAEEGTYPPLPEGSRQVDHVVNLVGSDTFAALVDYMGQADTSTEDILHLDLPVRVFYDYYRDEYDFLLFVSESDLSDSIGGLHEVVYRDNIPGTGLRRTWPKDEYDYVSTGRLKSAIGLDFRDYETRPPMAHEILHHWANHMDASIGFGDAFQGGRKAHWGTTSVRGQLGGFDADSLRCETPQDAVPPNCTPEEDGRIHYVVDWFSPLSGVDWEIPYAPLENYLMGFLDQSELPEPYFLLEDAAPEPIEENDIDGTMTVDAGGLREIYVSDILAVHGPRIPTPEAERNYAAALIVLTESPASDEMMAAASAWAEAFGGHSEGAQWPSFFELTGGRANMSMRLGERRDPTTEFEVHSIPPAQCSVTAQDCNVGFGCYFPDQAVCLVEGATPMGEECEEDDECAAGMGCGYTPELSSCAPYCNLDDTDMVTGCAVLCPEAFSTLKDPVTDEVTGGRCRAGTGTGICDPLLQDCGEGRGCYGREGNTCRPEGALLRGEICTPTGAVCEAGTTCIGIEGEDAYCMPYCDPTEAGEKACSLLCPGGSWNFGAHDICIPE